MPAYKVFLDSEFNPVSADDAALVKVVAEDGRVTFYHPNKSANTQKAARISSISDETIKELIAKWKSILHLDDWDITFTVKARLPRVEQGVTVNYTQQRAEIELTSFLTDETAEDDVAHEMLHLVLFPENWFIDEVLADMVRRKAMTDEELTALGEQYNLAQNMVIEALKRILASAGIWQPSDAPNTQKAMLDTSAPWERLAPLTDAEMEALSKVGPGDVDAIEELKPFLDAGEAEK